MTDTETLTIKPTNASGLQAALKQVGKSQQYDALQLTSGLYQINKPMTMNSGTEIYGPRDAIVQLVPNAPRNLFKVQVPLFGQAGSTIEDVFFHGFTLDGYSGNQNVKWGQGYDNFIFFQNAKNITMRNLIMKNSQGDGARFRDSKNIEMFGCTIDKIGHDGLHARNCDTVKFHDNTVQLRTNSGCRAINTNHVLFCDNKITGSNDWWAGGPGIQVDHSEAILVDDVEICNNEVYSSYGPGIWLSNFGSQSKDLSLCRNYKIHDNLFSGCGLNTSIDWVAGVLWSGVDDCVVDHNTIVNCYRHGIGANVGSSVCGTKPSGKGYELIATNNLILGTKKSKYGSAATNGYGIASTIQVSHSITAKDNAVFGNAGGNTINVKTESGTIIQTFGVDDKFYPVESKDFGRRLKSAQ